MTNGLFFNATVCWTSSEPSLQRLWNIQRKLSDILKFYNTWTFWKMFWCQSEFKISPVLNAIKLNSFSSHSIFIFLLYTSEIFRFVFVMIFWHLLSVRALKRDNTRHNTKKEAVWMQTWPDVCSALYKLREIWKVPFPAHCFCYFALLILFFYPALLYFPPFVSLRNNFSFHLYLPYTSPHHHHLYTPLHIFYNVKSHPQFSF